VGFFEDLFGKRPYPAERKAEVEKMIADLIRIGQNEDYLSEHTGGLFNGQYRNIQAVEIGRRLDAIGGFDLMAYAHKKVQSKVGASLGSHLSYAWADIGRWVP
jgi:hypothetical protein